MPLHDVGYRAWSAKSSLFETPSWVIATMGVQLAWKSVIVRRLIYLAWIPATYLGLAILAFEKAVEYPEWQGLLMGMLRQLPGGALTAQQVLRHDGAQWLQGDLADARYQVWALILLTLLRYPQSLVMVLLVGQLAPGLISSDLRSRSYLLYFSRPITLAEYLLGKSLTVWIYLAFTTALPSLVLYLIGVSLSADLGVVAYTWDLPLRILVASATLIIPTTALALALSSFSTENRAGMYAWFTVWVLGWTVYSNVRVTHSLSGAPTGEGVWWTCASLYHILGNVQVWVFGLDIALPLAYTSMAILAAITVLGSVILWHRVAGPLRV